MKISLLIDTLAVHGSVRRVINLSNALAERGHDTVIYCEDGSPCKWLKTLARIRPIDTLLNYSHDVLLLMTNNNSYRHLADQAETGLKVFYVLGLDETNLPAIKAEGLGESGKSPFRRVIRDGNWHILANATWMYEWLRDNLRPDTRLLLGGIDRTIFHPTEKGPLSALATGGIREREGSGTAKEALLIALKKYPKLKIYTYDKQGYPQSEMARVYGSATVYVDGQWYSGWSNAVIEAMACGTAVCCTDIGGGRDFAFHNETALLSPPKDSQAMGENVLRVLGDEALRRRLTEAAYEVSLRFDWGKSAETLEELVKEWS